MDYKCVFKKSLICVLILIALVILLKLSVFYIPFLIAYIISIIIEKPIKWLNKKTSLTRRTCSIIFLVLLFSIISGLTIWGLISLISEATNLLNGLNIYLEKSIEFIQDISSKYNFNNLNISKEVNTLMESTAMEILNKGADYLKNVLNNFLEYITSIPKLIIYIVITILATYFITSDKIYILDRMEHHFSKKMVWKIAQKVQAISKSLGGYLKAELKLIGISFSIILVMLNVYKYIGMNIKYPILFAVLIGFVDALPILGTGTVMIPWTIISFLNKDTYLAISILGLYILVTIVKQFLEPKIVSSNIGIHPIFTLIAMYTGFKISGIIGLLIGPIILIILKSIFSETIEKGLINAITKED